MFCLFNLYVLVLVLLPEIIEKVFSYLGTSDLKKVSLTCKYFREISSQFLWSKSNLCKRVYLPGAVSENLTIDQIVHLPIKTLKMSQFIIEVIHQFIKRTFLIRPLLSVAVIRLRKDLFSCAFVD